MAAAPAPPDRRVVLNQCRLAAEKRLTAALGPLLDRVGDKLNELGVHNRDSEERELQLVASVRLRNEREAYLEGFRAGLSERFDQSARALQGEGQAGGALDRQAAAMLRTNVLEHEVAVMKLGSRIKERSPDALREFSQRLAVVCRVTDIDDGYNPLGPSTLAHAVYAGFDAIRVEGRALRGARGMIEEGYPALAAELYATLNQMLQAIGVTKTGHAATPPPAATPSAAPAPAVKAFTGASSIGGQTAAVKAVASALHGREIPPALHTFINETWMRVLAVAHDHGGAEGGPWRAAVSMLDEVVWSVQPKADAAEQNKLRALVPALGKRLDQAMQSVAIPPEKRKTVLDALVAHYRTLV